MPLMQKANKQLRVPPESVEKMEMAGFRVVQYNPEELKTMLPAGVPVEPHNEPTDPKQPGKKDGT